MGKRVFVRVVGFSEAERHALNTLFALSEAATTTYEAWTPEAPQSPSLYLIDGESDAGRAEEGQTPPPGTAVIWVGPGGPSRSLCRFSRPLAWPDVVGAMDELFEPGTAVEVGDPSDFDFLDTQPPVPEDPPKRSLIVSASLDKRLYLRAKLALYGLSGADEVTGLAGARERLAAQPYAIVAVDLDAQAAEGWMLLKELSTMRPTIPLVFATRTHPGWVDKLRAWLAGAVLFDSAPDQMAFQEALLRL